MNKAINKGFTLIELLVVIAIIGILASIVLVSLNSARNKGKDTRILSDVNQVRTQIETEASSGGVYQAASGKCITANPAAAGGEATVNSTSGNQCDTLKDDAGTNGGDLKVRTGTAGGSTFTAYAVYSRLASDNSTFYCVDSTGKAGNVSSAPTAASC